MEAHLKRVASFAACIFFTIALSGCFGVVDELHRRDAEISRLTLALKEQEGVRKAELDFQEMQAGIYRGCTYLINLCGQDAASKTTELYRAGGGGFTSVWFWVGLIAKLCAIAIPLSISSWAVFHFLATKTKPEAQAIETAKGLISNADMIVKVAYKKRTQAEQEASRIRRSLSIVQNEVSEELVRLDAIKREAALEVQKIDSAKKELAVVKRLRSDLSSF